MESVAQAAPAAPTPPAHNQYHWTPSGPWTTPPPIGQFQPTEPPGRPELQPGDIADIMGVSSYSRYVTSDPVPDGAPLYRNRDGEGANWSTTFSTARAAPEGAYINPAGSFRYGQVDSIADATHIRKPVYSETETTNNKSKPMTLRDYIARTLEVHWGDSKCRMTALKDYAIRKKLVKTRKYDGMDVLEFLCWQCETCKQLYHNGTHNTDRLRSAYMIPYFAGKAANPATVCGCQRCAETASFACHITGSRYKHGDFTPVKMQNRKQACYEVNEDRIAKHPDGTYIDATVTAGYHHGYRPWKRPYNVGHGEVQPRVYGVELEILCSSKRGAIEAVRKAAIENGLAAERDGSLDGDYGLEVVGPPILYGDIIKADGQWGRFLSDVQGKATGWDAGMGYGMHVNMHTKTFTILQLSKFVNFINHNHELIAAVAGRTATKHCMAAKAETLGGLKSSVRKYGLRTKELLQHFGVRDSAGNWNLGDGHRVTPSSMDKYLACSIRDESRVEVRSFRSTMRWDRFKRNIQFCDSVQRYMEQASNLNYLLPANYLGWLSDHQSDYPELCSFLYCRPAWAKYLTCEPCKKVNELRDLCGNDNDNAKPKTIVRPGKVVTASH